MAVNTSNYKLSASIANKNYTGEFEQVYSPKSTVNQNKLYHNDIVLDDVTFPFAHYDHLLKTNYILLKDFWKFIKPLLI